MVDVVLYVYVNHRYSQSRYKIFFDVAIVVKLNKLGNAT